jgi:hypothetical protein
VVPVTAWDNGTVFVVGVPPPPPRGQKLRQVRHILELLYGKKHGIIRYSSVLTNFLREKLYKRSVGELHAQTGRMFGRKTARKRPKRGVEDQN